MMSGLRTELFTAVVLIVSVSAGTFMDDIVSATSSAAVGIGGFSYLVFLGCDPRICYSAGLDGLEPLRLGAFLGALAVCGASVGIKARSGRRVPGWQTSLVLGSAFVSVAYYPVVFTLAGTRLLFPYDPWGADVLLFVLAAWAAGSGVRLVGRRGTLIPLAAGAFVLLLTFGIALAYFSAVAFDVGSEITAIVIGSLVPMLARLGGGPIARSLS